MGSGGSLIYICSIVVFPDSGLNFMRRGSCNALHRAAKSFSEEKVKTGVTLSKAFPNQKLLQEVSIASPSAKIVDDYSFIRSSIGVNTNCGKVRDNLIKVFPELFDPSFHSINQ